MNQTTVADIGEFGLIQRIQAIIGSSTPDVLVGLGDDAATVQPHDKPLVISTDAMVQDVHFRLDWTSPEQLAHKALASSLSDLAAKAACPAYTVITIGLPSHTRADWIDAFYRSLAAKAALWQTQIIGGDTVSSQTLWISLTVWGYQTTPTPIRINAAKPGDKILVSGYLGDAAGGLALLFNQQEILSTNPLYLVDRFSAPSPRLQEAQEIVKIVLPTAMTDISDGISRDVRKVCGASQTGARLEAEKFPLSSPLRDVMQGEAIKTAWQGGEDYELLLTLSPEDAITLMTQWNHASCPLTIIGEITEPQHGIVVNGLDDSSAAGFDHFK